MRNQFNVIRVPQSIVLQASVEASLAAASAFGRAERELAFPKEIRRSAATIHREASSAMELANRFARRLGGAR